MSAAPLVEWWTSKAPIRGTMSTDLTGCSVGELASLIREKRASSVEVVEAHLRRIERVNPSINAVVRLDREGAIGRAREADAALAKGENWGVLHGVPFTLKDMHETAMLGASVGTRATERVPAADGVIMERLKARGAILLGKTNMVNALQTISEQFGRSSNPYDNARTTGGSSGGAAAAVAAGLSPFDVGTDLSGSIRMPAHFCGVFGLRPTPHRIPVSDLVTGPIGFPRLDRVLGSAGPIARTAADVALLFRVLAGPDPRDPEVPPVPVIDASRRAPGELRVAIMPSIGGIRIARDIQGALENLGRLLSDAGAHVEHREAVPFDELLPSFRRYLLAGLSLAIRAGIAPPGAKSLGGPEPTLYDVMVALDERDRFIARLDRFFADYDVLIGPAATVVAFPHCAPGSPIDVDGTSLPSICVDHPTILSTYTGSPSLVVPIARTEGGLPIGAQVIGRRWQDEHLVAIGAAIAEVAGPMPPPTVGASSR